MASGCEGERDRDRDVPMQQPLLADPVLHEGGPLLHLFCLVPSILAGGSALHQVLQRRQILLVKR